MGATGQKMYSPEQKRSDRRGQEDERMFRIEGVDRDAEFKTLENTPDLFHIALKEDPKSGSRFHVRNGKGSDFDIVYYDNNDDLEDTKSYPKYVKPPYMADYCIYDENDTGTLWLEFFDGVRDMMFEELNEYTIVLTRLVLSVTDIEVYCTDFRILWFVPENERLHVREHLPEDTDRESLLYIRKERASGIEDGRFRTLSSTYAFHNVFLMQWILGGRRLSDYRFITVEIEEFGGIGAVLSYCERFRIGFERFGLKFVQPGKEYIGKFRLEELKKFFVLDVQDEEANEGNTLTIPSFIALSKIKFIKGIPHSVDGSDLTPEFRADMDEYYDGLFGDEKVLGVMIRGTDYVTAGMKGDRKMATADQMAPLIHEWVGRYGFERVFLATEDEDALEYMRQEFGSLVVALSQERLRVSDLRQNEILTDYEKEHGDGMYEEKLEDTTINYFYALYILSKCDSFVSSGRCNGSEIVLSLNNGRFSNYYKFAVGVEHSACSEVS